MVDDRKISSSDPDSIALDGVTILNADDAVPILTANERFFHRCKAIYIRAENGEEALEAFPSLPDGSFVILDNHMGPGPTGMEIAATIKSCRSDLTILLTSGDADQDVINQLITEGILDASFPKPYDPRDIRRYIAQKIKKNQEGGLL